MSSPKGSWTWFLYSKRKLRVVQFVLVGRAGRPDMSPVPDPLGNMHTPVPVTIVHQMKSRGRPFVLSFPKITGKIGDCKISNYSHGFLF